MTQASPPPDWDAFRTEVATIACVDPSELRRGTVVGADLMMDSLGVSELSAFLLEMYQWDPLDEPSGPTFEGDSLGAVFDRASGKQHR